MDTSPLSFFQQEFARRAEWRREDEKRFFDQLKKDHDREKKEQQGRDDDLLDLAITVLATEAETIAFTAKLDAYDTAIVEALTENEQRLTDVRKEVQTLLDKAYVLPDGRRVFKTEDGTRVFDERGEEVRDIDPQAIEDSRPYWERYKDPFEREAALVKQQGDLHEMQRLSDDARAEVDEGGMTKDRMDELEQILAKNAPDPVKRLMPDNDAADMGQKRDNTPERDPRERQFFGKLDMPAL